MANEEDINCSICRNGFTVPVLTNCDHRFCGKCILVWLTRTDIGEGSLLTCPNCRASVTRLDHVGDVVGENAQEIVRLTGIYQQLFGIPNILEAADAGELQRELVDSLRALRVADGDIEQAAGDVEVAQVVEAQVVEPAYGYDYNQIVMMAIASFTIVTLNLARRWF